MPLRSLHAPLHIQHSHFSPTVIPHRLPIPQWLSQDAGEEEKERLAAMEQIQSDIQARSDEEKKLSEGLEGLDDDFRRAQQELKQVSHVRFNVLCTLYAFDNPCARVRCPTSILDFLLVSIISTLIHLPPSTLGFALTSIHILAPILRPPSCPMSRVHVRMSRWGTLCRMLRNKKPKCRTRYR